MPIVTALETSAGPADAVVASTAEFSHPAEIRPPTLVTASATPPLLPILVADDDADDRFFIQRFIKKTGAKNPVKTFDDGSEVVNYLTGRARLASSAVKHHDPLLLFLDLNMKGLGGFGFLEWARQQRELTPLTIVILSNSSEPADMARALELGAHRYLVKYPSVQTFATLVASVYPQTVF